MKNIILCILLFYSLNLFSQKFAVVDIDTYDLIESVTFNLYEGNKMVYTNLTENNKATIVPSDIKYDKAEFIKTDYKLHSIETTNLNGAVFLTKEYIQLDDVVVYSKKSNNLILGESNRIVNSASRYLLPEISFGVIFKNYDTNLNIENTVFYVDKIKHKTAYKIHYFEVEESFPLDNLQTLKFNNEIYSSDTLYLNPMQKNRIEVEHKEKILFKKNTTLFVSIEVLYYLNENNIQFQPDNKLRSKLKLQLSNKNNYYAKTVDFYTSEKSVDFRNINLMIKYDFAIDLFKTPHKTILLTPAILLNTTEIK
ncbi:hypothetical protein [Mangrovimonas sp. YM274]|uniref:hypothetical protein n=1 Tax=Mangrovimonas sp. YM274 TaxID=3070660 RepID=UPI0027DC6B07|nr:hypothetical protein [Mangrovimonas sp. YM274]WMI68239.1 hypothetical protein RBH95_13950 [Mangrovimonas sp. YM274]